MVTGLSGFRWLSLSLIAALAMLAAYPGAADEMRQAYIETDAEVRSVVDSVQQTEAWIADAHDGLVKAQRVIRQLPHGPERDAIENQLRSIRDQLASHSKVMNRFGEYAGKVTSKLDMANALMDLHDRASQRAGGPLATQLTYLAEALESQGQQVPFIGDILVTYGKVTRRMLDATDKLARDIDRERNENMVGAGTYGFIYTDKQRALRKLGDEIADGGPYVPKGPAWLYRPVDERSGPILIWDQNATAWYRLDNNDAPLEKAYEAGLLIGKRYNPQQLQVIGEKWSNYEERMREAEALYDKLNAIRLGDLAYIEVDRENDGELRRLVGDRDRFIALYSFDQQGSTRIKGLVEEVRSKARELEAERKMAQRKREAARIAQANAARAAYLKRMQASSGESVASEPGPVHELPPPVTTSSSSASVDCDDIPDDRIIAIAGRLRQESPEMIASLSRSLFEEGEGRAHLACLCRATSSGSNAKVSYNPAPVEGSPACMDPSLGACVNQAFGCWRHALQITGEAMAECTLASAVAERLCRR